MRAMMRAMIRAMTKAMMKAFEIKMKEKVPLSSTIVHYRPTASAKSRNFAS